MSVVTRRGQFYLPTSACEVTWREKMGLPKGLVKGVAPVSGPYDMRVVRRTGEVDGYVPDEDLRAEASPILNIDNPVPRAVVAYGSLEPFEATSRELVDNMKAKGGEGRARPARKREPRPDGVISWRRR